MGKSWQKSRWLLVLILIFANFFVWRSFLNSGKNNFLTLAVLDIGQGDAIFIEDHVGHQILIDGGPDNSVLTELPRLMDVSDRTIDLLILSHPHADHLAGLVELIKRYEVKGVLEAGAIYRSATYDEWHRLLVEKKIPIILARRGERVILAGGSELDLLAPFQSWAGRTAKNIHESMVVAQLFVASSSVALLTGDMEKDLENNLIGAGDNLKSEILKVGHHGSKTSTSRNFLEKVKPKWAVISVAQQNRYGLPAPQTIQTLESFQPQLELLRTSEQGTIVFKISRNGEIERAGARP